jgi:2-C-methyl-D-erythritol 2,4-cyclodiphosphate synthase
MTYDPIPGQTPYRVGHGFDRHRLAPVVPGAGARFGGPLILGGVRLDSPTGPVAHSDGDALLHAITDAICGACGLPDIGQLFPDTDPANKGRNSMAFLIAAAKAAGDAGWSIVNIDATVLLERPMIGPYKDQIIGTIAGMLSMPIGAVNVKGKTGEGVGPVGRGEAIEAHAVVLCCRAHDEG